MASVEPVELEAPRVETSRGWGMGRDRPNESGLKATADHHILNVSGFSITTEPKWHQTLYKPGLW